MAKKPKPTFIEGKTYFGPDDERRRVTGVDGDTVNFVFPKSMTPGSASAADFDAWRSRSWRRTYVGADGETRTRVQTVDATLDDDGAEITPEGIEYVTPEEPYDRQFVATADWDAWRAQAV